MTRRLLERSHRRLARRRPPANRADHGQDLALVSLPEGPWRDGDGAARADPRALRALAEENATLARELGRVQARCTQWRDDCIAQADRLETLLMRARADCIVKETRAAALRETLAALHSRAAGWLTHEELVRRLADLRARNRSLEGALAQMQQRLATGTEIDLPAQACLAPLATRRVLCVGGRARQIPVYRELVERGGGGFAHIAGVDAACLPQLLRALAEADLVILQPGYVCQGACHAVEAHCARTGVRCVQLDKACALGFAHTLAEAIAAL
jgi:hypothetical protein